MSLAEQRNWNRLSGLSLVLLLLLATGCRESVSNAAAPTLTPTPAPERTLLLTPDTVVQFPLKGGESHRHRIDLPPGQFADLTVEQEGIDVVLKLSGPDGRPLPEVDSPNSAQGPEPLPLLGAAGPLILEVRSSHKEATTGVYAVRIGAVRPATDSDRNRVVAERNLAAAKELRGRGDGASLRDAVARLEPAIAQFEALGDQRRAADARYVLGRIHLDLGVPVAALPVLQKALATFRATGSREDEGRALGSLGKAYLLLGKPGETLVCSQKALALQLGNPSVEAVSLNNQGRAQATLGRIEEARASYDKAISLWNRLGNQYEEGKAILNRARLFETLGDEARALDDLDQSLPLLAGHPELAGALQERGYLRGRAGRVSEAIGDLTRALGLQKRAGNRRDEAVTRTDLARLWQTQGRIREARQGFEAAAAVLRELGDHPSEAATWVSLGHLWIDEGNPGAAEGVFQRALQSFVAASLPEGEAQAWMGLAKVRRKSGDIMGALQAAEAGLSRIEALRTQPASRDLRTSFFASYQDAFVSAVDTAMELHIRQPAAGHDAHAFEISERARARSLLDAFSQAGIDPLPDLSPALQSRQAAASLRLEAAEQRRQALIEARAPADQVAAAERSLRRYLGEIERLEAEARRATPAAAFRPLTVKKIRAELCEPDTILLEYSLGERRSFLWVVSSSGLQSYELPPRAEIVEAAREAHRLLADAQTTLSGPDAKAALARLSRMLLAPAVRNLAARRLLVVPDGALHLIPFSALPDPAAAGEPLLARHEVVTVPSASSLVAIRRGPATHRAASAVVAVLADPVFEASDRRVTRNTRGDTPHIAELRDATEPDRTFSRLSFTREEARTVLSLAPPGDRLEALDFAARRDLVTSGALEKYRIVHFATHGVVNTEHPEMSGVALSMVDELGGPQNGFLRSHEIYRLRLPADLVVLSACETALGKEVRGEGMVGLTRAFLHAGARRVLVSLWPVEDQATARLMRGFYEGLFRRGLPPSEALRQAQDAMRREPDRQHPHYWAGFVLQGDWRPLTKSGRLWINPETKAVHNQRRTR